MLTDQQIEKVLVAITTRGTDLNIALVLYLLRLTQTYPKVYLIFLRSRLCAFEAQFTLHKYMLSDEGKKYDYALMIDSDIIPHARTLEMLYQPQKDICVAPAWHGDIDHGDVHLNIHPKSSGKRLMTRGKGVKEIVHCSMASALIHRSVYDSFSDEPLYSQLNQPFHLHTAPTDILFTNKVRRKGFKIWVNWDIDKVGHYQKVLLCDDLIEHVKNVKVFSVPMWDFAS